MPSLWYSRSAYPAVSLETVSVRGISVLAIETGGITAPGTFATGPGQ